MPHFTTSSYPFLKGSGSIETHHGVGDGRLNYLYPFLKGSGSIETCSPALEIQVLTVYPFLKGSGSIETPLLDLFLTPGFDLSISERKWLH